MITIKTRKEIARLYKEGARTVDIAERFGICLSTVYHALVREGIQYGERAERYRCPHWYMVYDRDENFLCQGTAQECADYLGIKRSSFYKYVGRDTFRVKIHRVKRPSE